MKREAIYAWALLGVGALSSCSNLHLVEQIAPEDRRVPVAIPPEHAEYLYELDGAYYIPITVAMAKEELPLITSGMPYAAAAYTGRPTYTPDADTQRVYLFRLEHKELPYEMRPKADKQATTQAPAFIPETEFPFARAKKHPLISKKSRCVKITLQQKQLKPASTRWEEVHRGPTFDSSAPYPIGVLPVQPGTRSWGNRLAYVPLVVLDAAGNVVLKGTEIAIATAFGSVVAVPVGILYLCGERLP